MNDKTRVKHLSAAILQKAKSSKPKCSRAFLSFCFLGLFIFLKTTLLAQTPKDTNAITIKGIHHINISVQDLDASVAFYKNAFALQELERTAIRRPLNSEEAGKIPHFKRETAFLKSPNVFFELTAFKGAKNTPLSKMPIEGAGITHVCYQAPMAQAIYEKVKTLGAKMVSRGDKPVDLGGYGIYYAYTREANNIMFEMEHFDNPPFKDPVWVGHVAIVTPDIDRLVAFYTRVLGIRPHSRADNIKPNSKLDDIGGVDSIRLRGAWFKLDNMQLELWQYDNPRTPTPNSPRRINEIGYHSIAFEVGDLDKEYARLTTWKIPFLSKPIFENKQKTVFLRDPDNNLISLIEYEQGSIYSINTLKKMN
jgi:catechol 2,3-dioxygenase-like lactoylglutathione lyase family enzyme